MKKKYTHITILLALLLLLGFPVANAQERKIEKANQDYEQLNYIDAQKIYLAVANKGYASEEIYTKLGNSYYFNAQYDEAVKWYEKLFELNQNPEEPVSYLRYSQALKATGKNKMAAKFYNMYLKKGGIDTGVGSAIDYEELIQLNSDRYQIQVLSGVYDEKQISFGQTRLGDKLVYSSTADSPASFSNKKSAWDGLSFLSLYEIELDENDVAKGKPTQLKGELSSKFHESSPVFTKDGKTMYFSRSNITAKKKKDDKNLKIYRAKKDNGKWQEPEELNINADEYSTAHPALSPDDKVLYFASDRPGGFGGSDLYAAQILEDGSIGQPVNMGAEINTSGKETFPYITSDNELYFSSDGHFGLGGLDVFYVKITKNGHSNILNVGSPVNSYADDFAYGINTKTKRGFVSSNRTGVEGQFVYDNIYNFLETSPIIDVYQAHIDGHVTDKQTGEPIVGATVTLTDPEGKVFVTLKTDQNGHYTSETNKFYAYTIRASHEHYDTDEKMSEARMENQQIDFQLQQNKVGITSGTDLAKVLNIPIIYFDFDKSNIRPDAQVELEKVYAAMKEYPQIRINIRSHTDSRGNDAYNMKLSDRRAKSTKDYIVAQGIDASRLTAEGLGESELVNRCENGVPCSAEEHQKNRRSEFIILD